MKNRYSRNVAVIGKEGQAQLREGSVFVIGCGALGGQVAMLLAGAGVGRIGLADFDTIDISNLQRQLFFSEGEAGEKKGSVIRRRMLELNSEVTVEYSDTLIRRANAASLLSGYDFIVDATDNPATKYLIDDLCLENGWSACIGGVAGWRGQLTSVRGKRGESDCTLRFSDFFPRPEKDPEVLPCQIEGVIGAAASTIASLQAAEAIKFLTGQHSQMLFNRMLTADLLTMRFHTLSF